MSFYEMLQAEMEAVEVARLITRYLLCLFCIGVVYALLSPVSQEFASLLLTLNRDIADPIGCLR